MKNPYQLEYLLDLEYSEIAGQGLDDEPLIQKCRNEPPAVSSPECHDRPRVIEVTSTGHLRQRTTEILHEM